MNLYGHNGQWLMVDCGVTFNAPLKPGDIREFEVVCADPSFITRQKENLAGLVITHAHEDHIGAVAHLWRRLRCPVYTTAFTAEFLRRKLAETGLVGKVPVFEVPSGGLVDIGPFNIHWLALTHSLPEPHSLVIRTEAGAVFHTGDWKIDQHPVIGAPFDPAPFQALADQNVLAMICDSTNTLRPGRSVSEGDCFNPLLKQIEQAKGRVVVACFGSNIARLITLCRIAEQTKRFVGLMGRSLQNIVSVARTTGHWPNDVPLIESSHLAYLPRSEVLAIATGSQGEPRTALGRLASDTHFDMELESGDTVIFSSIIIPGNEQAVARMINQLRTKGINIIMHTDDNAPIHASGHPCAEEVKTLYQWVQPAIAAPTHGEAEHLTANARIAKSAGIKRQMTGKNGDLFVFTGQPRIVRQFAQTGRIILRE
ncbi:MAG: ribonuclease J [Reinekea sp.]